MNLQQRKSNLKNRFICIGRHASVILRNKAGSSLVEVMAGAMILGLVFGGAFTGVREGFTVMSNSRSTTRASQILQSEMENLRVMSWNDLVDLPAQSEFVPQTDFGSGFISQYTCTRSITDRKADQKEVVLRISWTDDKGISKSKQYLTFFSKGGLNDYYSRTF